MRHVLLSTALTLLGAASAVAQVEGPIEEPIEGPIGGPVEGPIEGEVEGASGGDLGDALTDGDTGLTGLVVDGENQNTAMPGVRIEIRSPGGTIRSVTTTSEGRFQIALAPGLYMVRAITDFYAPTRLEDVEVRAGEITHLPDTVLTIDDQGMLDTVVSTYRADTNTEATQLQVRRQSAAVRDAVSAEEISRSGDSSASSAARRVVATTIRGGQYLYVRGLGGRYTNVLLDGAPQPQLDPDVPGVQLDLFPSSVLASISVVKSYSVDLPGVFGGGTMLLETKDYPAEWTFGASLGFEYNSQTTWRRAPTYRGGRTDWLGFDDGSRALPGGLSGRRLDRELESEELDRLATSFGDDHSVRRQMVGLMPFSKIGLSLGGTIDLPGSAELGVLGILGWGLDRQRQIERVGRGTVDLSQPGGARAQDALRREAYEVQARLTGLGKITLQTDDDHALTFTTLFNQIGEDYTGIDIGRIEELDGSADSMRTRLRWNQRTHTFNQLSGQHFLGNAELRWRMNATIARFYEPDTRDFRYGPAGSDIGRWPADTWGEDRAFNWQDRQPVDGQRLFFDLSSRAFGGGMDLTWDHRQLGDWKVQVGGAVHHDERDFVLRRFEYNKTRRPSDVSLYDRPPGELFANANYGDAWVLRENTGAEDGYDSQEDTFAAYLAGHGRPVDWLRLYAGVRVEAFRQQLQPDSPFATGEEVGQGETSANSVFRTDVDALPVGSAVFVLPKNHFIRASYAVTVARPRARELSPTLIVDFVRNRTLFGSPDVARTRIQNFDLRWEFFPGATEVLALTAFAKLFEDPIELVILSPNLLVSYQNAVSARNFGFEAEARIDLGRIDRAIRGLNVGGNFTYVHSRVTLTEAQIAAGVTSPERSLVGQAPWVVNASIGYDPDNRPFGLYLFYNVYGPTLEAAAVNGVPDAYRRPFHSLDFNARWDVSDNIQLKLAAKNLLLQSEPMTQGNVPTRSFAQGMSVSLGMNLTY